jgi:hypothetical protein
VGHGLDGWFLGMTGEAHVTGVVMFSLVVGGVHGCVSLLAVSTPSVGLDGTQDQARPSLNSTRFRGRVPAGVGGLRWKRERESHRQRHLPRAGDGVVVLVLGPWRQPILLVPAGKAGP